MNANDAIIAAAASAHADPRHDASRVIRAPRGSQLTCKSWLTKAAYERALSLGAWEIGRAHV